MNLTGYGLAVGRTHIVFACSFGILSESGVGARKGEPAGKSVGALVLGGHIVIVVIGGVKCDGAAHGLKVETVSARGAGIYHVDVFVCKNVVPQSIVPLDIAVFHDSHAVGRVGGPPNAQNGAGVEVLAVEGNSPLVQNLVYAVAHPGKSLGVSEVKHTVSVGAESRVALCVIAHHPFFFDSVFFKFPSREGKCVAFGLEPKNRSALHVKLAAGVGNGLETGFIPCSVDLPASDIAPTLGFCVGIPACVHPPVINVYVIFEIVLDIFDLFLFGKVHHFLGKSRNKGLDVGFAVLFIHIAVDHPPSPKVGGAVGVTSVVENDGGQRSPCRFARL